MGEMQDTLISGDTIYQMTQDSEEYLKSLKQWAHDNLAFDDIDYHIRYGSPKRIISYDFVKDHGNNLIVMGATGLNAVERMLMGSVTEYVNQHAMADVLIVRTDVNQHACQVSWLIKVYLKKRTFGTISKRSFISYLFNSNFTFVRILSN